MAGQVEITEFQEPGGEVYWTVETGGAYVEDRYVEVRREGWEIQTHLWDAREDRWFATGRPMEPIPEHVASFVRQATRS